MSKERLRERVLVIIQKSASEYWNRFDERFDQMARAIDRMRNVNKQLGERLMQGYAEMKAAVEAAVEKMGAAKDRMDESQAVMLKAVAVLESKVAENYDGELVTLSQDLRRAAESMGTEAEETKAATDAMASAVAKAEGPAPETETTTEEPDAEETAPEPVEVPAAVEGQPSTVFPEPPALPDSVAGVDYAPTEGDTSSPVPQGEEPVVPEEKPAE